MATELAISTEQEQAGANALLHVLGDGDLAALAPLEKVGHYLRLCRSLGLNPLSRPFDWLLLKDRDDGPERLVLYANQSCAAQLRRQHHMRVEITRREVVGDLFVVEAMATTPDGRVDVSSKYVPITGKYGRFTGSYLANAMMKAETGAKRRVTLSMVGLAEPPGPDEGASWRHVIIDGVGQVIPNPTTEQTYLAANPAAACVLGEPVYEDAEVPAAETDGAQAATSDELSKPEPPRGPRPSFTPSAEDVERWNKRWHATVEGTTYAADDERHRFIRAWTSGRTESLRAFLQTATESQAEELLTRIRIYADEERAAVAVAARLPGGDENDPFDSSPAGFRSGQAAES